MRKEDYFGQTELPKGEEKRWMTEIFDITMNPREWMARNGHNILAGDFRRYIFEDKEFEKWIYEACDAFFNEGLEKLWSEFLSEKEIEKIRYNRENF